MIFTKYLKRCFTFGVFEGFQMTEEGGKEVEDFDMMNVEEEVERLKEEIKRLGQIQPNGSYKVTFGVLFNDDKCGNIFEALVGTLRAAKKRKFVAYDGELRLQGVHDNVEITLEAATVTLA
ncbi:hypothetical protein HHK36_008187 [Tetracentron sinense]|uniref:Costars domain-containing protein n=1 Tax=Tetracentron sinense TaxID=13715 RepID=A0A834ZG42_TETSI|nr:hypothetical protein HHK36_008187 [Tetracentron sinense]